MSEASGGATPEGPTEAHPSPVWEAIGRRRSVRAFSSRPIPRQTLELLIEAARRAPSSCNSQPWHFTVVTDRERIERLGQAALPGTRRLICFVGQAAAVIVIHARPRLLIHRLASSIDRDCHLLDIGAAGEHIVLLAAALGIGSCWVGWLDPRRVNQILGRPSRDRVVAMLALGYPKEPLAPRDDWDRRRHPRKEICTFL